MVDPRAIMAWSEGFYRPLVGALAGPTAAAAFRARENDYVLGDLKFAGNAQAITRGSVRQSGSQAVRQAGSQAVRQSGSQSVSQSVSQSSCGQAGDESSWRSIAGWWNVLFRLPVLGRILVHLSLLDFSSHPPIPSYCFAASCNTPQYDAPKRGLACCWRRGSAFGRRRTASGSVIWRRRGRATRRGSKGSRGEKRAVAVAVAAHRHRRRSLDQTAWTYTYI